VDPEERGELICKPGDRGEELDVSRKHFLEEAGRKRVCVSGNLSRSSRIVDSGVGGEKRRKGRGGVEEGVDGGNSDGEWGVGEDDDV
jgi:hypothetical protein